MLIELLRRGAEVGYVRTGEEFEVDFLARFPDGRQELIQACADLGDAATREREARALLAASREHPRAGLSLITLTPESGRNIPPEIQIHNAAIWLLTPIP